MPGMSKQIAVFVRFGGPLLVPCRAYPTPVGAMWYCAHCNEAVISASFGVLSGFWRCQCGAEVSLFVDGDEVEIQELNALGAPSQNTENVEWQARGNVYPDKKEVSDQDFLRECGISAGAIEEEPC